MNVELIQKNVRIFMQGREMPGTIYISYFKPSM